MNHAEESGFNKSASELGLPENERTRWLMQQQHYLRILARKEIGDRLGRKIDPSDLVQQTLLEAWQGWDSLRATDGSQRLAWLRKILSNQLAKQLRHYCGTDKRKLEKEISIEQSLAESAARIEGFIIAEAKSPSHNATLDEQRFRLAASLDALPEDYRQVIFLRNFEDLSHQQIGQRMGRSDAAVRMLWLRAIKALTDLMAEDPT